MLKATESVGVPGLHTTQRRRGCLVLCFCDGLAMHAPIKGGAWPPWAMSCLLCPIATMGTYLPLEVG